MTDLPANSLNWAAGGSHPLEEIRNLVDGTRERVGSLPADYAGLAGRLVMVLEDESGLQILDVGTVIDFAGAQIGRGPALARIEPDISGGFATLSGAVGSAFDLLLTSDIAADGINFTDFPDDGFVECVVRLMQDEVGGHQINGATDVTAAFDNASFDFGVATVTLPTTANGWIELVAKRWGSDEPWYVREIDRRG
jgi:hypothetical protein